MVLASHFHDEIVRQATTSVLLIVAGLVLIAIGALRLARRGGRLLVGAALAVTVIGGFRLAETSALRHNHLCHAHNFNPCRGDHAHNEDGHTHRFGGRAAKPE